MVKNLDDKKLQSTFTQEEKEQYLFPSFLTIVDDIINGNFTTDDLFLINSFLKAALNKNMNKENCLKILNHYGITVIYEISPGWGEYENYKKNLKIKEYELVIYFNHLNGKGCCEIHFITKE